MTEVSPPFGCLAVICSLLRATFFFCLLHTFRQIHLYIAGGTRQRCRLYQASRTGEHHGDHGGEQQTHSAGHLSCFNGIKRSRDYNETIDVSRGLTSSSLHTSKCRLSTTHRHTREVNKAGADYRNRTFSEHVRHELLQQLHRGAILHHSRGRQLWGGPERISAHAQSHSYK